MRVYVTQLPPRQLEDAVRGGGVTFVSPLSHGGLESADLLLVVLCESAFLPVVTREIQEAWDLDIPIAVYQGAFVPSPLRTFDVSTWRAIAHVTPDTVSVALGLIQEYISLKSVDVATDVLARITAAYLPRGSV